MINIETSDAIRILDEIVEECGEGYVYYRTADGRCQYLRGDEYGSDVPDCIIGHLLARKGVSIGKISQIEDWSVGRALEYFAEAGVVNSSLSTRGFLSDLQRKQDDGLPWSKALTYAKMWLTENEA